MLKLKFLIILFFLGFDLHAETTSSSPKNLLNKGLINVAFFSNSKCEYSDPDTALYFKALSLERIMGKYEREGNVIVVPEYCSKEEGKKTCSKVILYFRRFFLLTIS